MKFDASRAESFFRELGDLSYTGPDGEAKAAEFVGRQFEASGLSVERLEVSGSRFPQRVAPWVGWPGYGLLVTSVYVLGLQRTFLAVLVGFLLSIASHSWFTALVSNWIRPGRRLAPLGTSTVVIGSIAGDRVAGVRVVFQAVISGLKADPFHFSIRGKMKWIVFFFLSLFPAFWFGFVLISKWLPRANPRRVDPHVADVLLFRYLYPPFLALVWVGILMFLASQLRQSRIMRGRIPIERGGLAVLLEMARTWPRTGSRPIEPVFVAAGGQDLDYAGSREIVRRLKSEWASRPTLLVLFFAPAAGDRLWLSSNDAISSGTRELAEEAANGLWLPIRKDEPFALLSLWPFENYQPCVALIGSDPRAFFDESVDPGALDRAAQLATEIALRWAKKAKQAGTPEPAG